MNPLFSWTVDFAYNNSASQYKTVLAYNKLDAVRRAGLRHEELTRLKVTKQLEAPESFAQRYPHHHARQQKREDFEQRLIAERKLCLKTEEKLLEAKLEICRKTQDAMFEAGN